MENDGLCEFCNYREESDASIDSYILKIMTEENCCCPVYQGTCQCPTDNMNVHFTRFSHQNTKINQKIE